MILAIMLVIFGLALEWGTLAVFLKNLSAAAEALLALSLALHTLACAAFSFGMHRAGARLKFESLHNWSILCFVLSFVFPCAGIASMLAVFMLLLMRRVREGGGIFDDYKQYITYDFRPDESPASADRLLEMVTDELEVSPIIDVLSDKDVKLRRGAVAILDKLTKKEAVRMLKFALEDKSVEIRFYASVGLSKIETEINNNIDAAKKEVERTPEAVKAHLSLANSYAEYCDCGILDPTTAGYYMDLAIEEYKKTLELGGDDMRVLNSLANLEAIKKRYDSALSRFRRVCELDPSDVYANVGIIQVLFETGNIPEAIGRAKSVIDKMPKFRGPMKDIIEYWSS